MAASGTKQLYKYPQTDPVAKIGERLRICFWGTPTSDDPLQSGSSLLFITLKCNGIFSTVLVPVPPGTIKARLCDDHSLRFLSIAPGTTYRNIHHGCWYSPLYFLGGHLQLYNIHYYELPFYANPQAINHGHRNTAHFLYDSPLLFLRSSSHYIEWLVT